MKQRVEKLENKLDVHKDNPILVFSCYMCKKPQSWINTNIPKKQGDAIVGNNGWCECLDNPYPRETK